MRREGICLAVLLLGAAHASCAVTPRTAANPGDLHLAAQSGDLARIDAALRAGGSVDVPDGHGRSALLYAAALPDVRAVEHLLDRGANPNFVAGDGDTPLLVACRNGRRAVVEALVRRGARIDAAGDDGLTGLAIAAAREDRELFDGLLALGARTEPPRASTDSALLRSIPARDPWFFDRLLAAGADPNRRGRAGNTPLILATAANRPDLVNRLLAAGARAGEANDAGLTALHFACGVEEADPAMARALVEAGSDPDRAARNGLTPLKAACQAGRADLVVLLHERGARPAFDDASDDDLETKGSYSHILADHLLATDRPGEARALFATSRDCYRKAAERYQGDVSRMVMVQALAIVAQAMAEAAGDLAMASQARMQSRQLAQISAMRRATDTRTGFAGYSAYMAKYHRPFVPTYPVGLAARPPPTSAPLEARKAFAREKARQFGERSDFVGRILECYDRHPGAGADLQGCVASLPRSPGAPAPR